MKKPDRRMIWIAGAFGPALGFGAFSALEQAFAPPAPSIRAASTMGARPAPAPSPAAASTPLARVDEGRAAAEPPLRLITAEPSDFFTSRFGTLDYDAAEADPRTALPPVGEAPVAVPAGPGSPEPVAPLPRHRDSHVTGPITDLGSLDAVHAVMLEAHPEMRSEIEALRAEIEADLNRMATAGGG
jgi:hypothetical protein